MCSCEVHQSLHQRNQRQFCTLSALGPAGTEDPDESLELVSESEEEEASTS